jgi:hypothetical protein
LYFVVVVSDAESVAQVVHLGGAQLRRRENKEQAEL